MFRTKHWIFNYSERHKQNSSFRVNALGRDVSSDETSNSVYIVSWMKDPINYFYVLFTKLPSQTGNVSSRFHHIYIYYLSKIIQKF